MTLNLHIPSQLEDIKPTITVVGVGGAGGNAVNNMITSQLEGVNFVAANTDAQALGNSLANGVLQLGKGLGAGGNPDSARQSAEEAAESLAAYIQGSHMVFITAGMGGGTGTGAAPAVAKIAKEMDILTVAVVTKPFHFEGTHRMRIAEAGIRELQEHVDTLIIIPNQNLFRVANERTTFSDAFRMADEVLHSGVRGVTDLIVKPGLINLDFADIRAVMREMGKAMMGTGEATGDRRAIEAAEAAISNPLLDDVSLKGARALLINITGGPDMTLFEVDEAANRVRQEVDAEANIIFGSTFNDAMEGKMRVSVVATGIDAQVQKQPVNLQQQEQRKMFGYIQQPRPEPVKINQRTVNDVRVETMRMQMPPAPLPQAEAPKPAPSIKLEPAAQHTRQQEPMSVRETIRPNEFSIDKETPLFSAKHQHMALEQAAEMAEQEAANFAIRNSTVHASLAAEYEEDGEVMAEETVVQTRNLFQRLAEVGKAFSGRQAEAQPRLEVVERTVKAVERARAEAPRKAAVADEEQYLDIPAFLRRQAH